MKFGVCQRSWPAPDPIVDLLPLGFGHANARKRRRKRGRGGILIALAPPDAALAKVVARYTAASLFLRPFFILANASALTLQKRINLPADRVCPPP